MCTALRRSPEPEGKTRDRFCPNSLIWKNVRSVFSFTVLSDAEMRSDGSKQERKIHPHVPFAGDCNQRAGVPAERRDGAAVRVRVSEKEKRRILRRVCALVHVIRVLPPGKTPTLTPSNFAPSTTPRMAPPGPLSRSGPRSAQSQVRTIYELTSRLPGPPPHRRCEDKGRA
jgi:hypothetical protein